MTHLFECALHKMIIAGQSQLVSVTNYTWEMTLVLYR